MSPVKLAFQKFNYSTRARSAMFSKFDPLKDPLILVASIGNPSPQYDNTRHSVGHFMLERYCYKRGYTSPLEIGPYTFKIKSNPDCFMFYHNKGFMNESGKNLCEPWNEFRRFATQKGRNPVLVVLSDELDKDMGKLQIRIQNSSARGHNGLKSIQNVIGKGFTSIKIGIGRNYPGGGKDSDSVSKYVLGKFTFKEFHTLKTQVLLALTNVFNVMQTGAYIYNIQKG